VRPLARERGVSLVELVSVSAVILVLASITLPVASTFVKRQRELELRRALREIRTAIDRFQLDCGTVTTPGRFPSLRASGLVDRTNEEGYPEKLEWLVEGVDIGDAAGTIVRYLRRMPIDPITRTDEWATRSSRDGPEALFSDNSNIFDVRSTSDKVALDGTKYSEW
jgi:general secretion pathway protein G